MEMHSSDKITDAFVQRCIREGVDYRIWKRNFKPEGVAVFEGYLKERARNERKYVKRLTLRHGPFDILGGGGPGLFWKKISLL